MIVMRPPDWWDERGGFPWLPAVVGVLLLLFLLRVLCH